MHAHHSCTGSPFQDLSNPKIKFLVLQHEHETNDKNSLKTEFSVKRTLNTQLFLKFSQAGFVSETIHQKKMQWIMDGW